MKKISLILLLALVLSLFSGCSQDTTVTETVTYEDGSYMIETIYASGRTYSSNTQTQPTAEIVPQSDCKQNPNGYYSLSEQIIIDEDGHKRYYGFWDNPYFENAKYFILVESDLGIKVPLWMDKNGNPIYTNNSVTKNSSYYSADGKLLWTMSVTAIFKHNIVDQYCVLVSNNVTVYETDSWYVISESADTQENAIGYTVQFGRKNLGVNIGEPSYTMTLSRDEQGNFK